MDQTVSYVSHGRFGGWGEEKDISKATHVAITREYFKALCNQSRTIAELRENVEWYRREREQYVPTINKLNAEVERLKGEVEKQQWVANDALNKFSMESRWNADVYRIQVERSNAARGLTPKKEHSGYCILSDNQLERRYGDDMERMWEMTIQTPFPCEWPYEKARDCTVQDLLGGPPKPTMRREEPVYKKCSGLLNDCGITHLIKPKEKDWYHKLVFNTAREDPNNEYSKAMPTPNNVDIVYDVSLRRDFQRGYWAAVVSHIHPLKEVPVQMLPPQKEAKKKGTKKPANK